MNASGKVFGQLRAKPHQPYTDCVKIRLTSTPHISLGQEAKGSISLSVCQSVITRNSFFH